MAPTHTLSQHIQESSIDVLKLSTRSLNALQKACIDTVGDLIALPDLQSIKGIGKISAAELRRRLREYLEHTDLTDEEREALLRPYVIQSQAGLLPSILPLTQNILESLRKPRYFKILRLRYGLYDCEPHTLQEIGDRYDRTREAIRYNESRALALIRGYLEGELESSEWQIPERLIEEYRAIKEWAYSGDAIVTEDEAKAFLKTEAGPELDFLMKLLELDQLPTSSSKLRTINLVKAWLVPGIKQVTLCQVTKRVYDHLHEMIVPVSLSDVATTLDVERRYVDVVVKWCADIELSPEGMVQVMLSSAYDKAYRILCQHGKPMHIREITRQIGDVKRHTVSVELTSDDRFEPIGMSGKWTLASWQGICRKTIIDLVREFFETERNVASVDEVAEYVKSRRPDVQFRTVKMYLNYRGDLFTKMPDGRFKLGPSSVKPSLKQRIAAALPLIFDSHNEMPLYDLVRELQERTGASLTWLYTVLRRMECLTYRRKEGSPRRKIARFDPEKYEPPER